MEEVGLMPSNKIGKLDRGMGLRRTQAQKTGGFTGYDAKVSYEIGNELEPERQGEGRTGNASRWKGEDR